MRNLRIWLLIAVPLIAFAWTTPAWAPRCPGCTVTSLLLPLEGIVSTPGDPCVPTGEDVTLAGEVHVVTQARPNFVAMIHLNMAGVEGTGQTRRNMYIGTGADRLLNLQPGDPCFPLQANFTLEKTDGCASVPLPVTARLCLAGDGTLLSSSTVSVGPSDSK